MPTHIAVPDERAAQLKAYAQRFGVSTADALGLLLNDAITAGKLDPAVPGFHVELNGKEVSFEVAGAFVRKMRQDEAKAYAGAIRAVITASDTNPFMPSPSFGIVRRGSGIKLRDLETGAEKVVAPSVASDVARLIEAAADAE